MILPEAVRKLQLPKMVKITQNFPDDHLEDTAAAVRKRCRAFCCGDGMRVLPVAVLAGKPRDRDIDLIVKTVVEVLLQAGVRPFIVPAMGSHGGGNQRGRNRSFGITESPQRPWAFRSTPPWRQRSSVRHRTASKCISLSRPLQPIM